MWGWGVSVVIFAGLAAGPTLAQVPPTASPDRLDERFDPPETPESKPEILLPEPTPITPPDAALDAQFTLTAVTIEGATVFDPSAFEPLYRPLLGRQVTLLDVYRLRDAITARYRSAGYTLSQAIIPPQNVESGSVRIQVIEGYIDEIVFEGDTADARGLLGATAEKIRQSRPLRQSDLERYILLLSDLPGVEVSTILKPAEDTPGAADLIIAVRRRPLGATLQVDNRGSRAIGPVQASLGVDLNNAFGLSEQTSVFFATAIPTDELRYVAIQHTQILGPEGSRLTFSASDSYSEPGGAISALSALGTATTASIFYSNPVVRSRATTLRLEAGFSYQNSRTDLLSTLFSRDRVRFGTVRALYDFSDVAFGASASTLIVAEAERGFDVFGASESGSADLSRVNGKSDYTLVAGETIRIQRLSGNVSLALAFAGQYSFDSLLSSQQFGLGGARFGRGYEPSELVGDHGVAFSIEPRVDLPIPAPRTQLYAFYDVGKTWVKAPLLGEPSSASLSSAGMGLRLQLGARVFANFELAKPLTRDIASRGNRAVRPLFSIATTF